MRPLSITILCWYLIITNLISCFTTYQDMGNILFMEQLRTQLPIPVNLFFLITYTGIGIMIASGFAIFIGYHWGRTLWLSWSVLNIIFIAITLSLKTAILPVIGFFIFLYYFYHPRADVFFFDNEDPLLKTIP